MGACGNDVMWKTRVGCVYHISWTTPCGVAHITTSTATTEKRIYILKETNLLYELANLLAGFNESDNLVSLNLLP